MTAFAISWSWGTEQLDEQHDHIRYQAIVITSTITNCCECEKYEAISEMQLWQINHLSSRDKQS